MYGSPSKPERHAHTARKLRATHSALEPQGKLAHKSDDWRKLLEPLGDEPTKLLVKLDGDENELSREPLFRMRPLVSPGNAINSTLSLAFYRSYQLQNVDCLVYSTLFQLFPS